MANGGRIAAVTIISMICFCGNVPRCGSNGSLPQNVSVAKCCATHEVFNEKTNRCESGDFNLEDLIVYEADLTTRVENRHINFVTGALKPEDCPSGYETRMLMPPTDQFEVVADGRLHHGGHFLGPSHYCVEKCHMSGLHVAIVCVARGRSSPCFYRDLLYTIGMCVSALGLALTMAVYAAVAELRNAPGKNLLCLASSLLLAYVVLVATRLMATSREWVCMAAALLMYFGFTSSFAWFTVISTDIWLTFGKRVSSSANVMRTGGGAGTRNRVYIAAGWGGPLLMTLVALAVDRTDYEGLRPNFGLTSCWFHDPWAVLAYFYGPIGCLLMVNFALFLLTTVELCRLQASLKAGKTRQLWRRHSKNKCQENLDGTRQRLALHFKLFVVMGLCWAFELLAWAFPSPSCWPWYVVTDMVNALQGLWMFLIYVAKEDVWKKLLAKLGSSNHVVPAAA